MKKKRIIHIITGDGKGKTTAALGLSLRALGAGKKVKIIQFMKKPIFSEHQAIKKYNLPIEIESFGIGFYKILGDTHTDAEHKKSCQKALVAAQAAIESGNYDLLILDEINVAIGFDLIEIDEVISILSCEPLAVGRWPIDIVLTGRNAHAKIKKIADLISDIKCTKHYFDAGVPARKGIEF
jgi:cob(I)alamin adenosyltransferase